MLLPIQSTAAGSPIAIAGTFASFAIFLSVTAHIAARNVLGDVPVRNAFVVGPVPAVVAILVTTFGVNPFVGLVAALVLDGVAIALLYEQTRRLSAYITFIHFVVSVILGTIIFGVLALLTSAPG
ncbi:hypothetical protein D3D02_04390 [Halobellus sp. Atlit-38R]|uniref:DUF7473 family protein n=1 Tax=Halobellus sp. Atlit-38R TaxID=2282131 RepID=UPI000EF28BD5|nr:hypothetical protein [Halobellus sp. Atlit-38R]RLM91002.1 hypothetical protein D3D02_04390 [Halobellus sp. Atlit-38R]